MLKVGDVPFTDVDGPNATTTFTIVNPPANGFLALASASTVPIPSFTYTQVAAGQVLLVNNGTSGADGFSGGAGGGPPQPPDAKN